VAVISHDLALSSEPGPPQWILDVLDVDIRLRVSNAQEGDIFVGVARTADVDRYLADVFIGSTYLNAEILETRHARRV